MMMEIMMMVVMMMMVMMLFINLACSATHTHWANGACSNLPYHPLKSALINIAVTGDLQDCRNISLTH